MRTITRAELVAAVEHAAEELPDPENRAKVLEFAKHTPRVAIGDWSLPTPDGGECMCPLTGAGINRFDLDAEGFAGAQAFANRFDRAFGVSHITAAIFEVIDGE